MAESIKIFFGSLIKENMLVETINWQTTISNIYIFYFPRECEKK